MNNESAFIRFFSFFPKLIAAQLMFAVPLAVFTAVFVLIGHLSGFNNIILWSLGIIPAMPAMAGLTAVVRKIAVEKNDPDIKTVFFTAVKDNFKAFLVYGLFVYIVLGCTFFSVLYYGSLAAVQGTYLSMLFVYLLFTALLTVMMFYIPLMTITYELRLRDVYKNAMLLIFGKFLRNLAALGLVILLSAISYVAIVFSAGFWFWIALSLVVLFYPLLFCYISVSIISKPLQAAVGDFVNVTKEEDDSADDEAISEALSHSGDSDYVFVNGKMIKAKRDKDNE